MSGLSRAKPTEPCVKQNEFGVFGFIRRSQPQYLDTPQAHFVFAYMLHVTNAYFKKNMPSYQSSSMALAFPVGSYSVSGCRLDGLDSSKNASLRYPPFVGLCEPLQSSNAQARAYPPGKKSKSGDWSVRSVQHIALPLPSLHAGPHWASRLRVDSVERPSDRFTNRKASPPCRYLI